ncbi:MAG: DUF1573 domain-containing protein [Bacteroidales bacterium]|nr:DUF1573 domain-containing protein [Bacteroidales bacterium]
MNMPLKSLMLIACVFFYAHILEAQNSNSEALLKFDKENHNFGKVYIDDVPEGKVDIGFTNAGTQPLVLSNVRGCCGTRIIDWPKHPILPGQSGTVKIEFEIQPRVQTISRTVTILSNSKNSPDIFRIIGEITDEQPQIINRR